MPAPLMPKATAVWLVENTSLTFDQIAEFCGLHPLEVQAIADGEVAIQMQGLDPVANGQTTAEEIERAQADPDARLKLSEQAIPQQFVKHTGPRYTPISKRQDKPDAIMYLLRNHPELSDGQISKLVGTTKPTIAAARDRTHGIKDIKPRHPVGLGPGVTHVPSTPDPETPDPPAFAAFAPHWRLALRFHDIIETVPDRLAPARADVERLLAFGHELSDTPESHLLIHCHAGVSRSTASATLILAQARPDRPAREVLDAVAQLRPRAWPNLRILEFGDDLLGRNGEIVAAVAAI